MRVIYFVERKSSNLDWCKVSFVEGNRSYCDGYVDAMGSLYPSDPCRIVRIKDGSREVVRETKGRGEVHLN
jgi:hypothetical protein